MLVKNLFNKKELEDFHSVHTGKPTFGWEKKKVIDSAASSYDSSLQEIDLIKSDFFSAVSHELRTPLTSVRALAEIVYNTPELEPKKQQEFLGIIIKESDRLSRTINDILDFKKVKIRQIELEKERLDFREVIQDSIFSIAQLIDGKNIELILELSETPVFVIGIRNYLIKAMVNLISNAIKFCDCNAGRIRIGMEVQNQGDGYKNQLIIFVEDNGIGIAECDQDYIFLAFRQVNSKPKGRPTGIGIGLTIVKQIINSHGGKVRVNSDLGKGATFFITLPLIE